MRIEKSLSATSKKAISIMQQKVELLTVLLQWLSQLDLEVRDVQVLLFRKKRYWSAKSAKSYADNKYFYHSIAKSCYI